jgi:hypothetical protein
MLEPRYTAPCCCQSPPITGRPIWRPNCSWAEDVDSVDSGQQLPGYRCAVLVPDRSSGITSSRLGSKSAIQGNGRHLAWVGSGSLGGRTRSIVGRHHGGRHEQRKRLDGMCLVRSGISAEPWWVKLQPKREMRPVLRALLPKRNAGVRFPLSTPMTPTACPTTACPTTRLSSPLARIRSPRLLTADVIRTDLEEVSA